MRASRRIIIIKENILTGGKTDYYRTDADLDIYNDSQRKKIGNDRRIVLEDGTVAFDGDMDTMIDKTIKKIEKATEKERIITAGTRETFIQNEGVSPDSETGSEHIERGIASQHGYTVIGIERKKGVPFVRLRNPWGKGTVESIRNPITGNISYRRTKSKRLSCKFV